MRRLAFAFALAPLLSVAPPARAFTHVVQPGETLAQIAERLYGKIQLERVLVVANGLDLGNGTSILPGMRLEVPAPSRARASVGDTWASLAKEWLGDAQRADVLAQANEAMPWVAPADGAEIVVPYNLRYVAVAGDTIVTVAQKFLGSPEKGWILARYNHHETRPVVAGDPVLVPLVELSLTEAGVAEAVGAEAAARSQSGGATRDLQKKVENELPALLGEVRSGRYVDAVSRGVRLLASGELTKPQLTTIHRQLTEAYVALDASGLAAASCAAWRANDPSARLDPVQLSPKVIAACGAAKP